MASHIARGNSPFAVFFRDKIGNFAGVDEQGLPSVLAYQQFVSHFKRAPRGKSPPERGTYYCPSEGRGPKRGGARKYPPARGARFFLPAGILHDLGGGGGAGNAENAEFHSRERGNRQGRYYWTAGNRRIRRYREGRECQREKQPDPVDYRSEFEDQRTRCPQQGSGDSIFCGRWRIENGKRSGYRRCPGRRPDRLIGTRGRFSEGSENRHN